MHLDKMLAPEISPEVNNLPRTQSDQHAHGANSKPLDSLIGTLIRIPKPLLTPPQVIHFPDNLADDLFDPTQFGFDGLELLAGGDGVPVLCVGTNVNVEFDMAGLDRLGRRGRCEDVGEADVEDRVGVRGECVAVLAYYVLGAVVVVAHCVADLEDFLVSKSFLSVEWAYRYHGECNCVRISCLDSRKNIHAYQPSGHLPCTHPVSP